MASIVSELLWLCWLLCDLEAPQSEPTPVYCDNQKTHHIANNPVFHERKNILKWIATLLVSVWNPKKLPLVRSLPPINWHTFLPNLLE